MRYKAWVPVIAMAMIVSGCTSPDDSFGNPGDGYPGGTRKTADSADWGKAESVVIELAEFRYSPETLKFRKDQPYALTLKNTGMVSHTFMARGFFRAIAAKSLVYSDAESSFPLLEAIRLEPQETKTLYFVSVTPGDYHLSCDRPLHATLGMLGRILIE